MRPTRRQFVIASLLAFGGLGAAPAASPVVVDKPAPHVEIKYFNPAKPPKEMPELKPGEAAITQSQFAIASAMEVTITQQRREGGQESVTARVKSIKVTLGVKITIWLPENATDKIIAHEQGHRRISEQFYRDAEKKVESIARPWIGKEIDGKGKDAGAAGNQAMDTAMGQISAGYLDAIAIPSSRAQEKYDDLTDHGRNRLDEDEAIRRATAPGSPEKTPAK